jgi:hypothetical protein
LWKKEKLKTSGQEGEWGHVEERVSRRLVGRREKGDTYSAESRKDGNM